jgi:hypothetical protein
LAEVVPPLAEPLLLLAEVVPPLAEPLLLLAEVVPPVVEVVELVDWPVEPPRAVPEPAELLLVPPELPLFTAGVSDPQPTAAKAAAKSTLQCQVLPTSTSQIFG